MQHDPLTHHGSIRDISVSDVRPRAMAHHEVPEEHYQTPPPRRGGRQRRRLGAAFVALALFVVAVGGGGAFLLSTSFAGAEITVHPRVEDITYDGTLTARLNPPAGELSYQLITVRRSTGTVAQATGSTQVKRQASGSITVYNNFSTTAQLLIANTRFEAPDGKIYRTKESVTVPGAAKKSDGTLTPSTINVVVYADSPGEAYNRAEPTRFTIPGFKGDPRYEGFYAESKNPIQGGFVGDEPTVSKEELAKAEAMLKKELETAVRGAVLTELPEGFLPVPGTLSLVYGSVSRTSENGVARLTQDVTATAAIVRAAEVAAAIAEKTVDGYRGEAVMFSDVSAVTLDNAEIPEEAEEGALYLKLSGTHAIVWQFDTEAVKQALSGTERTKLQQVIEDYAPAIASVEASLRPFWQSTFPDNPDKIIITTGTDAL